MIEWSDVIVFLSLPSKISSLYLDHGPLKILVICTLFLWLNFQDVKFSTSNVFLSPKFFFHIVFFFFSEVCVIHQSEAYGEESVDVCIGLSGGLFIWTGCRNPSFSTSSIVSSISSWACVIFLILATSLSLVLWSSGTKCKVKGEFLSQREYIM